MFTKGIFIFILFSITLSAKAKKDSDTLMKLIEEEEKALLAVPAKKRWPALYWKVMLLNMEKFRIIRSEENVVLLKESPDVIARKGRAHYFRKSLKSIKKSKKWGQLIVKKWPNFKHNDEVLL